MRNAAALVALIISNGIALAHFLFLVPAPSEKLLAIFSDSLVPDPAVSLDKLRGAKFVAHLSDGKNVELKAPANVSNGAMSLELPANTLWVHGEFLYGVYVRMGESALVKYYALWVRDLSKLAVCPDHWPLRLEWQDTAQGTGYRVVALKRPLPGAEVVLLGQSGEKPQRVTTDNDGTFAIPPNAKVQAIRVGYVEKHSGEYEGKQYQQVRHYLTLVANFHRVGKQVERIEELPSLPTGLASFGAAVLGDYIYVFGGHSGRPHYYHQGNVHGALYRLDWRRPQRWERLADHEAGQGLALLGDRDRLYRIGGSRPLNQEGEEPRLVSSKAFAAYDSRTNRWEPLPELPEPRSSFDAAVVGGRIYVFGGWQLGSGERSWHEHGLVFDSQKPQQGWQRLPQPFRRRALAVVAWKERVYVLGGLRADDKPNPSLEVDIFDPQTATWHKGPTLPGPALNGFSPAACVHHGTLYLSPGDGKLYRYQADSWQCIGSVAPPRVVHRLVSLPDGRLCIIGGSPPREPSRGEGDGGMLSLVQTLRLEN